MPKTGKKISKEVPDIPLKEDSLKNMVFVFTGAMDHFTREKAKEFITERGGMYRTALSKKTNYLVTGKDPGLDKLERCGGEVKIIAEDQFIEMVKERSGVSKASENLDDSQESEDNLKRKPEDLDHLTESRKKKKIEDSEQDENDDLQATNVQGATMAAGSE
eukprot:NODE_670_length_5356_cov_0.415066.p3 type:complete len:162 gc:universal NODE_670_length_5356_cov_0.415066:5171-4686(-)